ncbi:hypothetical protein CesoFtcFv8_027398 [Champsocephalus esox]|uniref:Uncharacterized protein n=1 Tax=Champsocephalus esox TaxID=159716 RepID=A0AAN7Y7H7_9TELE|nr:hypothetical protein CesoFtcFv8_027398 [Champsocephalus esox]
MSKYIHGSISDSYARIFHFISSRISPQGRLSGGSGGVLVLSAVSPGSRVCVLWVVGGTSTRLRSQRAGDVLFEEAKLSPTATRIASDG